MEKMPPIEKIYEAYSAVADHRVSMGEDSAGVLSSNHGKEYTVTWKDGIYTSNDNASYWKGYAGYPIIAVLILQGKLSIDPLVADYFQGINWTELNARYKSKYKEAVSWILDGLKARGIDCERIIKSVNETYRQLEVLDITCRRSALKPPKSNK